jgi:hypothetical protein
VGVLGRRAPDPATPTPVRAPIRVLRADGRRIDLTSRDNSKYLVATQQPWQKRSFDYRDLIGELRYAVRLLATAVARVRFYPAEVRPWPQDPVPLDSEDCTLDKQLIADTLANFERLPFDHNPDGFTARLVENLKLPGEVWVHIDADDRFTVRSISEVTTSQAGQIVLNALPGGAAGHQRTLDPATEELLRLWVPHPEYGELADSPMRSLSHVAEDVVLAGREQRAASRSRLAANGILLVPQALSLLKARDDDEDDDGIPDDDVFFQDLVASFMAPITSDDEDPAQIVPIVLRGDAEDLEKVRHVTVERADSEQLVARQTAALLRLLKGMDVQPEQIDGVGGMNHWGAWIIDSRAIKDQVLPTAETVAACLMQAYMSPALTGAQLDHDPAQVRRIMIAVDTSDLAENPNRGQDARDAHQSFAISDETLRRELGFDESDKPGDEEIVRRLATSGALSVVDVAAVFGLRKSGDTQIVEGATAPALPAGQDRPAAQPGDVVPESPLPAVLDPADTPVTASASLADDLGLTVANDLARRLTDIDAALAERITVAADAAVARVLERAGSKVRSQAQKDRALAGKLGGVEAHLVASTLGRQQVEAFVPVRDLLTGGYGRLKGQVTGWIGGAAGQTTEALLDALGIRKGHARYKALRAELLARLTARTGQAWDELARILDAAAEQALFADDPLNPHPPEPGESATGLIRPRDITDVLTVAGGGDAPAGDDTDPEARRSDLDNAGFATGPTVLEVARQEGAVLLGWEWHYRPEIIRDTYTPHERLDGVRFESWNDSQLATDAKSAWIGPFFHPRDHKGCLCRTGPLLVLADPDTDANEALRKAGGDVNNIPIPELRQRVVDAVDDMRQSALKKPRRRR